MSQAPSVQQVEVRGSVQVNQLLAVACRGQAPGLPGRPRHRGPVWRFELEQVGSLGSCELSLGSLAGAVVTCKGSRSLR